MKNFADKFDINLPKTKAYFDNLDNLRFFLSGVFLWTAIYMTLSYICITFLASSSIAVQIIGTIINKSNFFFFLNIGMSLISLTSLFVSKMFRKNPLHSGAAFFTFFFCSFSVFLRTVGTPYFKVYFDFIIFTGLIYSGLYFYVAVLHAKSTFKYFDLYGYVVFVSMIVYVCYN